MVLYSIARFSVHNRGMDEIGGNLQVLDVNSVSEVFGDDEVLTFHVEIELSWLVSLPLPVDVFSLYWRFERHVALYSGFSIQI
ncbi:hypothetical protein V6N11_026413 [Hibiscus sabdariffa]|uniref:Uncharacterized protein n=1 Tax=Hibiscus sabdariffa TaxID=183260 RepID=A0ABR2SVX9_9ROSI